MKTTNQPYVLLKILSITAKLNILILNIILLEVLDSTIELKYCPTSDMLADILTKGLTNDKFSRLRDMCGIKDPSACKEC